MNHSTPLFGSFWRRQGARASAEADSPRRAFWTPGGHVRALLKLNDHWRVLDDPLQWILQVRKGQEGPKATGWRAVHYCVSRTGLKASVGQLCGPVSPQAMAAIDALPDFHP